MRLRIFIFGSKESKRVSKLKQHRRLSGAVLSFSSTCVMLMANSVAMAVNVHVTSSNFGCQHYLSCIIGDFTHLKLISNTDALKLGGRS